MILNEIKPNLLDGVCLCIMIFVIGLLAYYVLFFRCFKLRYCRKSFCESLFHSCIGWRIDSIMEVIEQIYIFFLIGLFIAHDILVFHISQVAIDLICSHPFLALHILGKCTASFHDIEELREFFLWVAFFKFCICCQGLSYRLVRTSGNAIEHVCVTILHEIRLTL